MPFLAELAPDDGELEGAREALLVHLPVTAEPDERLDQPLGAERGTNLETHVHLVVVRRPDAVWRLRRHDLDVPGAEDPLSVADGEPDGARNDLVALLLPPVQVRLRPEAAGAANEDLELEHLAVGLRRRLQEDEALTRDRVFEHVSRARHTRTVSPAGENGKAGRHNGRVFGPLVDNLVAQLSRLPGVGTRTAQRLAFHLLRVPKEEALALAEAIRAVKDRIRFCRECGNLTEEELCVICQDVRRDRSIICVVEQPADLVSLERTHAYRGVYHVLGGALSPLDGVEPEHLRIDELLGRVTRDGVEEVVLATNPNMTGEATAAYLADRLRDRTRVTRLASGLPVGGDLEYADEVTLGRALSGRRDM